MMKLFAKPLMNKEYDFYKSIPPNITRFVPKFKGKRYGFVHAVQSWI